MLTHAARRVSTSSRASADALLLSGKLVMIRIACSTSGLLRNKNTCYFNPVINRLVAERMVAIERISDISALHDEAGLKFTIGSDESEDLA